MSRVAWNVLLGAPGYSISGLWASADDSAGTSPFEARESLSQGRSRRARGSACLRERVFPNRKEPAWTLRWRRRIRLADSAPSGHGRKRRWHPKPGIWHWPRERRDAGPIASNVKFRRPPLAVAKLADVSRVAWNAGLGSALPKPDLLLLYVPLPLATPVTAMELQRKEHSTP
jgi:hypothetical protein